MRYATPTRSAHRAVPAGGLAQLMRYPVAGQHRRPPARSRSHKHLRREPYRAARLIARCLAGLIVTGILVMVGVLVVADDRRPGAQLAYAEVDARIASRTVDPAPLSEAEVFPSGTTAFAVTRTDLTADCALAAGGDLRTILQRYGCSQAVRATLTVPYADHRITAGVLNLPDTADATAVSDQIRSLVETGDGGFTDMFGAVTESGTPVLWRTRGHYVLYCVITGPDGGLVPADTPQIAQIARDLLDAHLHDRVLIARAT